MLYAEKKVKQQALMFVNAFQVLSRQYRWELGQYGRTCVISGFHHDVHAVCAFLGYYVVYSVNSLPAFCDNLSVPSSRVKKSKNIWISPLKMGPIGCLETSVRN